MTVTTLQQAGEEAQKSISMANDRLDELTQYVGRGPGGRELALAITKAQEMEHWFAAAMSAAEKGNAPK
jgi:hypothetical protein